MRWSQKAGLLYGVTAPSTNTKVLDSSAGSHCRTSGGKNTGAAVLARTSCQRGILRLQSFRCGSLYFASGLLLIGHGESVVTFLVTASRRHLRLSGSRVVSPPKTSCSWAIKGSALYKYLIRSSSQAGSNICFPVDL